MARSGEILCCSRLGYHFSWRSITYFLKFTQNDHTGLTEGVLLLFLYPSIMVIIGGCGAVKKPLNIFSLGHRPRLGMFSLSV